MGPDNVFKASLVSLSVHWDTIDKFCHEYGAKMHKNLTPKIPKVSCKQQKKKKK